jgi:hypothetical protein
VSDSASVSEDNGVHRADRRGLGREIVEAWYDALLERVGYIQTDKTAAPGKANEVGQGFIGETESVEVEQSKGILQPEPLPFTFMHSRRSRFLDPPADERGAMRETRQRVEQRVKVAGPSRGGCEGGLAKVLQWSKSAFVGSGDDGKCGWTRFLRDSRTRIAILYGPVSLVNRAADLPLLRRPPDA